MDSQGGETLDGIRCSALPKFKRGNHVRLNSGEKQHLACIWEIKHYQNKKV